MNHRAIAIVAFVSMTLVSGCWFAPPWGYDDDYAYDDYAYDDYWYDSPGIEVVEEGELAGDFADFDRVDPVAAEVQSYGSMVEVITPVNDGAMAQFEVMGDISTIPTGTSVTWNMYDDSSVGDLYVIGVGCAGGGPVDWEIDELAEEVTMTVHEAPAVDGRVVREYSFEARFPTWVDGWQAQGSTVLTGRFMAFADASDGSVQAANQR